MVRMPDGMRDFIAAAAAKNGRSMNSEIVSRLERYDSVGVEAAAMFEVARALAVEIDKFAGTADQTPPLTNKIADVLFEIGDNGEIDRAATTSEFAAEAQSRLRQARAEIQTLPEGLAKRVRASAVASGRSMAEEIVYRLENSFEATDALKQLGELHLETVKTYAENTRREVEEYRQMATTIRIMRYAIDNLAPLAGEKMPDDVRQVLALLTQSPAADVDLYGLLRELYDSMERHEKLVRERPESNPERLRALLEKVDALTEGKIGERP